MKPNRVRLIVSLLLVWNGMGLVSNHAIAEEKEKRKATIDFEDELVEGELKKPELFYLLQKKQFNYKRLIKLRENFLPEMRRDAEEMRAGSKK